MLSYSEFLYLNINLTLMLLSNNTNYSTFFLSILIVTRSINPNRGKLLISTIASHKELAFYLYTRTKTSHTILF